MGFDAYWEWLKIPAGPRPPTDEALLGLEAGETDEERIRHAAMERYTLVRRYALGPQAEQVHRILGEIAQAVHRLTGLKKTAADEAQAIENSIQQWLESGPPPAELPHWSEDAAGGASLLVGASGPPQCPRCGELVNPSARTCPLCQLPFKKPPDAEVQPKTEPERVAEKEKDVTSAGVHCSGCGKTWRIPDSPLGHRTVCPACNALLRVPGKDAPSPETPVQQAGRDDLGPGASMEPNYPKLVRESLNNKAHYVWTGVIPKAKIERAKRSFASVLEADERILAFVDGGAMSNVAAGLLLTERACHFGTGRYAGSFHLRDVVHCLGTRSTSAITGGSWQLSVRLVDRKHQEIPLVDQPTFLALKRLFLEIAAVNKRLGVS